MHEPTRQVTAGPVALDVPVSWSVETPASGDPLLVVRVPEVVRAPGACTLVVRHRPLPPEGAAAVVDRELGEYRAEGTAERRLISSTRHGGFVRLERTVSAEGGEVVIRDRRALAHDGHLVDLVVTAPQRCWGVLVGPVAEVVSSLRLDGVPVTDLPGVDGDVVPDGVPAVSADPALSVPVRPLDAMARGAAVAPLTPDELARLQTAGFSRRLPRPGLFRRDPVLRALQEKGHVVDGLRLADATADLVDRIQPAAPYLYVRRRTRDGEAHLHAWLGDDGAATMAIEAAGAGELALAGVALPGLPTAVCAWLGVVPTALPPADVPRVLSVPELEGIAATQTFRGRPAEVVWMSRVGTDEAYTLLGLDGAFVDVTVLDESSDRVTPIPLPPLTVYDMVSGNVRNGLLAAGADGVA